MTNEAFQHEILPSTPPTIRLLRFLSSGSEDVSLSLEHVSLAAAENIYDAVSYTWGPPGILHPIFVNHKTMLIRENIWHFLKHFQETWPRCTSLTTYGEIAEAHHKGEAPLARLLWIDSICIDQDNVAEKTQQVQLMGKIFSNACNILMWLGSEASRSSALVDCVCDGVSRYRQLIASDNDLVTIFTHMALKDDDSAYEHYRCILNAKYWTRLWIVQEVLLASNAFIILGRHMIGVEYLLRLTLRPSLGKLNKDIQHLPNKTIFQQLYALRPHAQEPRSLAKLFTAFHLQECSNRKDKVFGLLGLCRGDASLTADYSWSCEAIFARALQDFEGKSPPGYPRPIENARRLAKELGVTSSSWSNYAETRTERDDCRISRARYTLEFRRVSWYTRYSDTESEANDLEACENLVEGSDNGKHLRAHCFDIWDEHCRPALFDLIGFDTGVDGIELVLEYVDRTHLKVRGFAVAIEISPIANGFAEVINKTPGSFILVAVPQEIKKRLEQEINQKAAIMQLDYWSFVESDSEWERFIVRCSTLEVFQLCSMEKTPDRQQYLLELPHWQ